jgi:UDP-galactopyranose mutase
MNHAGEGADTKTALIIGGGFAGCASAHQLALLGDWGVTLVEAAPFLGAGVRTMWYGGHPHTFGPRHFLTQNEKIFEFLNRYVPLRRCADHQFLSYVERDQQFYGFPIHMDDVKKMPDRSRIYQELEYLPGVANAKNLEDYWISSVGPTLYEKFIKRYNEKMWHVEDNKIIDTFNWSPKGVAIKEGPREAWDNWISAYPYAPNGYDDYFEVATKEAQVCLSTRIERYDIPNKSVVIRGEDRCFDVIVNTISPDILFGHAYGALPYLGIDFHRIVLPVEHCFPEDVYFLYYPNNEAFKRLVEYKKFTHHQAPTTLIGMEIPSMNGKYYPMPIKAEKAKAQKYFDEMPDGVFSIGRAGSYLYDIDIDDTIRQAMEVAEKLA